MDLRRLGKGITPMDTVLEDYYKAHLHITSVTSTCTNCGLNAYFLVLAQGYREFPEM